MARFVMPSPPPRQKSGESPAVLATSPACTRERERPSEAKAEGEGRVVSRSLFRSPVSSRLLLGLIAIFLFHAVLCRAADVPRGFFVEDLSQKPPVPAFYNIERHQLESFHFKQTYTQFIDVVLDREHGRVFFSARQGPKDPFRVYLKPWPNGEEAVVYENPLGPFRFLLSPDSKHLALQVMGPSAWPILAVHEWESGKTTLLGQGFSPDWSEDGGRLLFLQIPGSLPSYLAEYRVDLATSTVILEEPVTEAVYSETADKIILKTVKQSQRCDEFQVWDRRRESLMPFSTGPAKKTMKHCTCQREMNAFPGHRFFYFKESESATDLADQTVVISDAEGGRLQVLPNEAWNPKVTAVESATLAIGEDPLSVMSADGTGGAQAISGARFIRFQK